MNIIDKNLSFGSMNMSNEPNMLIVHHLEAEGDNWTVETIHNMHKNDNGWAGIGYHYYIRLDGSVYKGRPDSAIGAHCQGCNTNTLGVSFEGNYDSRTTMPDAQFNAWCELKSYLEGLYGSMSVYGHKEKGSSECPGANFPLDNVKNASSGQYKQGWGQSTYNEKWYYYTDTAGNYYKDQWAKIDGYWYYFDSEGYVKTGWLNDNDDWFYLNPDSNGTLGVMKTGWIQYKNKWCYLEEQPNGNQGLLYVNCKATINGKEYQFNKDGYLIENK